MVRIGRSEPAKGSTQVLWPLATERDASTKSRLMVLQYGRIGASFTALAYSECRSAVRLRIGILSSKEHSMNHVR